MNEGCKTRLGNRIPQESSRGLGNKNCGYSFTTKRVKLIFPCHEKSVPTIVFSLLRSQRKEKDNLDSKASDFLLGGKLWLYLYFSQSLSKTEATLVILTKRL